MLCLNFFDQTPRNFLIEFFLSDLHHLYPQHIVAVWLLPDLPCMEGIMFIP